MIPLFKVAMSPDVLEPVAATLMSGYIGQGPRVDEFEAALVPWFGAPHVLTVNSGTSAIHLALRLAGVEAGDEVISTPMTCTATNEPILERGAKIVWADIDPLTANIDPADVERKITPKTKAIVVVHWGGYPCDLSELQAIAQRHGLKLIEDAAHAFGSRYKDAPIGSHGDFVCFSFQAIKHLTTVDGGALVCRSPEDYRRGKLLRWYGIDRETPRRDFRCEEDIVDYGYKFHMNDVCATIGLAQLNHIAEILAKHRANAKYFDEQLVDVPGMRRLRYKNDRQSAYWLYTILVERRIEFMAKMAEAGVTVSQVHARNDKHTMVRHFAMPLPGVDAFVAEQVSIPVGWWLTAEERAHVAASVRRVCQELAVSTV